MTPYRNGQKKKLPGKKVSETIFSNSKKCNKKQAELCEFGAELFYSHEDPNGMYTGYPADPNEVPMQDQDDL